MSVLLFLLFVSVKSEVLKIEGKSFNITGLVKDGTDPYQAKDKDEQVYWNVHSNVSIDDFSNCDQECVALSISSLCYCIAEIETEDPKLLDDEEGFSLTYKSYAIQDGSFTIKVVCDKETSKPTLVDRNYYITVTHRSPCGCPLEDPDKPDPDKPDPNKPDPKKDPKSKKLSFGSIMLIILSVLLVLYFAAGIPIMKFGLKKEGIEIIPFVRFWLAVPGLVIDGVKFILSPCLKSKSGYKDVDKMGAV